MIKTKQIEGLEDAIKGEARREISALAPVFSADYMYDSADATTQNPNQGQIIFNSAADGNGDLSVDSFTTVKFHALGWEYSGGSWQQQVWSTAGQKDLTDLVQVGDYMVLTHTQDVYSNGYISVAKAVYIVDAISFSNNRYTLDLTFVYADDFNFPVENPQNNFRFGVSFLPGRGGAASDLSLYPLLDGTRSFTGPQKGVPGVDPEDFVTVSQLLENNEGLSEFQFLSRSPISLSAHQGIASDGSYFYATGGDTSNVLLKFDLDFNLVGTKKIEDDFSDYALPYYGDLCVLNGRIYVTISNYPNTSPRKTNILVYEAETLEFIGSWSDPDLLSAHGACICYGLGYFWVAFESNPSTLRQYTLSGDANFTRVADFPMPEIVGGEPHGSQGIVWHNGMLFSTNHDISHPVIDVYSWDGSSLTYLTGVTKPSDKCTQGIDVMPDGKTFIMVDRNYMLPRIYDNRIVFSKLT